VALLVVATQIWDGKTIGLLFNPKNYGRNIFCTDKYCGQYIFVKHTAFVHLLNAQLLIPDGL
jgi:hypothetical protein